ncbi:hypothetical protein ACPOL_2575 [Acidisarcina polymorpha]|uniref:Uncharacterized protein n=1 Tax=Acidisarcina polymorpha TaxID=2211140 RepID=A0A2Z5FYB2_9BACT|nr:hypothetical protein ACPOL_2575 [Acidisarcina polymorpha]
MQHGDLRQLLEGQVLPAAAEVVVIQIALCSRDRIVARLF